MGQTLYLECYSGISGDMTVAALLDLGADRRVLEEGLKSMPVDGYEIRISRVKKAGVDACDFDVVLDHHHENHDHDMEYLHGHEHVHEAGHHGHEHGEIYLAHGEEHHDHHGHGHEKDHYSHEYVSGEGQHSHGHVHGEGHHSHGHEQELHSHGHIHGEELHHHDQEEGHHDHVHEGEPHTHSHGEGHSHEHRGLPEILELIHQAKITDRAKEIAERIFQVIAEAEAKAHGLPVDQVHFHEVGAVDSIVDIVAAAICLDNLDITEVIVPELYEGRGTIRCQHGIIPVPVPAVVNIVAAHGLKLHLTDIQGELVTPTGAAIVAAIRTSDVLPEHFTVEKIGLGAGKRDYHTPGVVRAMLIRENTEAQDTVYRLETNIDDCTGEMLGYVMDRLLKEGARDVSYTPVYMKKNRPAYQLNVICSETDVHAMEEIIFQETTTIGIRRMKMERAVLRREIKTLATSLGDVHVKVCRLQSGVRLYAEYEDVAGISRRMGKPYYEVYLQIQREMKEKEKELLS